MTAVRRTGPHLGPGSDQRAFSLITSLGTVSSRSTWRTNRRWRLTWGSTPDQTAEQAVRLTSLVVIVRCFLVAFVPVVYLMILKLCRVRAARKWAGEASRRAGSALPGRADLVQVERPTGRTTWTRSARSGGLRCAMGGRWQAGHPGVVEGSGRVAPAAGGHLRVVGPEALPAGGRSPYGRRRSFQRGLTPPWCSTCSHISRGRYAPSTPWPTAFQNGRESRRCPLPVYQAVPGCSSLMAASPAAASPHRWYCSRVYGLSTQPMLQYGQITYSTANANPPPRLACRHLHPWYRPETVSRHGAFTWGSWPMVGRGRRSIRPRVRSYKADRSGVRPDTVTTSDACSRSFFRSTSWLSSIDLGYGLRSSNDGRDGGR